jgi:hypothetical protein
VTIMVMDNDARGWVMACVSGVGMSFRLYIISKRSAES